MKRKRGRPKKTDYVKIESDIMERYVSKPDLMTKDNFDELCDKLNTKNVIGDFHTDMLNCHIHINGDVPDIAKVIDAILASKEYKEFMES